MTKKEVVTYAIWISFATILLAFATVASVFATIQAIEDRNIMVAGLFIILGFSAGFSTVIASLTLRDLKKQHIE